jgi:hypothetical protein
LKRSTSSSSPFFLTLRFGERWLSPQGIAS